MVSSVVRFFGLLASLATLALICTGQAHAADLAEPVEIEETTIPEQQRDPWEATIAPIYGWVPGMTGDVGVLGVQASVNVTPIQILRNLDKVFEVLDGYYMGSGLIRYDRVGFFYDAIHFRVGSVQEFAGERTGTLQIQGPGFGPVQGPDLTLTGQAKVDGIVDVAFSHTIATFAATYRAYQTRRSHLDVFAGARVTDVELKVGVVVDASVALDAKFSFGPISKTFGVARKGKVNAVVKDEDTWVDPLIGARGRTMLDENWFATGWAMVGGFGIESSFLYDLMGGVGYEWDNGVSAFGGYRVSHTDYEDGDFKWGLTMQGPLVGVAARF
jgi:hypothetical protein